MPMKWNRYPSDWKQISERIQRRDGFRCRYCDAPNGQEIYRYPNSRRWSYTPEGSEWRRVRIVTMVHHIGINKPDGMPGNPDDKMDCREANLVTLCQYCHLTEERLIRSKRKGEKTDTKNEQLELL